MLIPCLVGGVVVVGLILSFIVSIRGQTLADKQINKLVEVHTQLLDHLAVAANPEAWLAQQAEKARQARREDERNRQASDETPDPEGVF